MRTHPRPSVVAQSNRARTQLPSSRRRTRTGQEVRTAVRACATLALMALPVILALAALHASALAVEAVSGIASAAVNTLGAFLRRPR
jgi:hypothetical protein